MLARSTITRMMMTAGQNECACRQQRSSKNCAHPSQLTLMSVSRTVRCAPLPTKATTQTPTHATAQSPMTLASTMLLRRSRPATRGVPSSSSFIFRR
eukprot:1224180-Rhodomonas_salina.6